MSAAVQETVQLASHFKVSISPVGDLEHVLTLSDGGVTLTQMQVQNGADPYVMSASGRPNANQLTISMLLTKKNCQVITNASNYFKDTMNYTRTQITLTQLNRDNSPGTTTTWHDCILVNIEHPKCQNENGVLTLTTVWQPNMVSNS